MSGPYGNRISSVLENTKKRRQEQQALLTLLSQKKKEGQRNSVGSITSDSHTTTGDQREPGCTTSEKVEDEVGDEEKNRILSDNPSDEENSPTYKPPASTALEPVQRPEGPQSCNLHSSTSSDSSSTSSSSSDEYEGDTHEHVYQSATSRQQVRDTHSPAAHIHQTDQLSQQQPPRSATSRHSSVTSESVSSSYSGTSSSALGSQDSARRGSAIQVPSESGSAGQSAHTTHTALSTPTPPPPLHVASSVLPLPRSSSSDTPHEVRLQQRMLNTTSATTTSTTTSTSSSSGSSSNTTTTTAGNNKSVPPPTIVQQQESAETFESTFSSVVEETDHNMATAEANHLHKNASNRESHSSHVGIEAQQQQEEFAAAFSDQKTELQDNLMQLARTKYSMSEMLVTLYHSETTLSSNAHSFHLNISNQFSLLKQLLEQREEYLLNKIEEIKTQHEHEIVDARAKISHCVDTLQHLIHEVAQELNNITTNATKTDFVNSKRSGVLQETISQRWTESKLLEDEVTFVHQKIRHPQLGIKFCMDDAFQSCRGIDISPSGYSSMPHTDSTQQQQPTHTQDMPEVDNQPTQPTVSSSVHTSAQHSSSTATNSNAPSSPIQEAATVERPYHPASATIGANFADKRDTNSPRRGRPSTATRMQPPNTTSTTHQGLRSPTKNQPPLQQQQGRYPSPIYRGGVGDVSHDQHHGLSTVPGYMQPTISNLHHQHCTLALHHTLLESKERNSSSPLRTAKRSTPIRQRVGGGGVEQQQQQSTLGGVRTTSPSTRRQSSRRSTQHIPPQSSLLNTTDATFLSQDSADVHHQEGMSRHRLLPGGLIPKEKRFHGTFSTTASNLPSGVYFTSEVPGPGPGAYNTASIFATANPTSTRPKK